MHAPNLCKNVFVNASRSAANFVEIVEVDPWSAVM
jgi:hypothetical protein